MCETGTGQQVAQLHERLMMMMMMMISKDSNTHSWPQRHIPEIQNFQLYICENFKPWVW